MCQGDGSNIRNALLLQAIPSPVPHKYSCVWEGEKHKQIRIALTIQKATGIGNQLKPLDVLWQFPGQTGPTLLGM